jgi:hypothetical protein
MGLAELEVVKWHVFQGYLSPKEYLASRLISRDGCALASKAVGPSPKYYTM